MPTFRCRLSTQSGNIVEKTLTAPDRAVVRDQLEREGYFVLEVKRAEKMGLFFQLGRARKRIKLKDFQIFNQEFSVLIKAGLPIVPSLNTIIEKEKEAKSGFYLLLNEIRDDVSGGESLSGAFGKHAYIFPDLYIASLQAGERSGNLPLAIARYIDYMKKIAEIRQKIITASVYPVILSFVSVFAILFLLIYVVPSFTKTYFEAGTQLPRMTLLLVNFSNAVKSNFIFILIFLGALYGAHAYLKQTEKGKIYLDKLKLKLPFFGELYIHYALSKLVRTLATVLSGGLTLVNSVRISSGTLDNIYLKNKLIEATEAVEKGSGFSAALNETKAFPSLAVRMIEAGESSGALEQVLNDIAEFYEADVDTKLSILTSSIEPALMVVMGLLIGFIVLAMYLPIFQMATAVG